MLIRFSISSLFASVPYYTIIFRTCLLFYEKSRKKEGRFGSVPLMDPFKILYTFFSVIRRITISVPIIRTIPIGRQIKGFWMNPAMM